MTTKQTFWRTFAITVAMLLTMPATLWADSNRLSAVLSHGDNVTVFIGTDCFANAMDAAEYGDIITLSPGEFQNGNINKSGITIFGAGYEDNDTLGIGKTSFDSGITIASSSLLKNLYIEGLWTKYIYSSNKMGIEYLTISRCSFYKSRPYSDPTIYFNSNINNKEILYTTISECIDVNFQSPCNQQGLEFLNSVVLDYYGNNFGYNRPLFRWCVFPRYISFSYSAEETSADFSHCIFSCTADTEGTLTLSREYVGAGSLVMLSLYVNSNDFPSDVTLRNCIQMDRDEIFADAQNGFYTPERTYALKHPDNATLYGVEVGINGMYGWSKVPSGPKVTDLQVAVEEQTLMVDYDSEVVPVSMNLTHVTNSVTPHAGTISHYAYWIDDNADNLVNVAADAFNGHIEIDVASLSAGEHTLSWMVRDANGAWSQIKTKTFSIDKYVPDDVNGDGQVSIADVTTLIDALLSSTESISNGDVNGDGKASVADITTLIDHLLGNN